MTVEEEAKALEEDEGEVRVEDKKNGPCVVSSLLRDQIVSMEGGISNQWARVNTS